MPEQSTQRVEAVFVQGPSTHTEWKPCEGVAESLPGFPELWQHGCTELSVSLVSCWLCDCLSLPELPHLKNPVDIVPFVYVLTFPPYTNPQSRPEHSLFSQSKQRLLESEGEHGDINSEVVCGVFGKMEKLLSGWWLRPSLEWEASEILIQIVSVLEFSRETEPIRDLL